MSTNDPARRGFLRHLASLPLIGGGLTLIGSPTAAAVPVTPALLDSYDAWLFYERRYLRWERYGTVDGDGSYDHEWVFAHRSQLKSGGRGGDFVRVDNAGGGFHAGSDREARPASNRAAVVLSAVGCDWKRGDR